MKVRLNILVITIAGVLFSCGNNTKSSDANIIESSSTADNPGGQGGEPVMTFDHDMWDFGNMTEGEVVEHDYTFKNTGGRPLLISDVQATCGCTIPEWPREPIRPGQEGKIKIQFNSAGKSENIDKHVTIFSNAKDVKKELNFKAYVKKKPEQK